MLNALRPLFIATLLLAPTSPALSASATDHSHWDGQFGYGGTDPHGIVNVVEFIGSDIYIGGFFGSVSGVGAIGNMARWDGHEWYRLDSGVSALVNAIATDGSLVYVGGRFHTAGGATVNKIAVWDGASWSALGSGVPTADEVFAVELFAGDVFVGGYSSAGGFLSRWDGSAWSNLSGAFSTGDSIHTLATDGTCLYVGGDFAVVDTVTANGVARWDGTQWSSVGNGIPGATVLALAADTAGVYVGGRVGSLNTPSVAVISQWDGATWTTVGGGVSATWGASLVNDLDLHGGNLYVAGLFDYAGGIPASQLAVWDGVNWTGNTGAPVSTRYGAISVAKGPDGVYVGSQSQNIGDVDASGIARWDGTLWHRVSERAGNGIDHYVYAIAKDADGDIIVGGKFSKAGGVPASRLARFDGVTWTELGGGVGGNGGHDVEAIYVDGETIYIGGGFTSVGGLAASNVAAWNGASWNNLGGGLFHGVLALTSYEGDLIAGGYCFPNVGCTLGHVARWGGVSWSGMGTVTGTAPWALHVYDGDLYVGGGFATIDGVSAMNIARWDGTSWAAVGDGFDSPVYALATFEGELYAGGSFDNSGGVRTLGIAKWDGSQWTEIGGGLWGHNNVVRSMCVNESSLCIGGDFAYAGEDLTPAFGIVRWANGQWHFPPGGTWDGSFPGVRVVFATGQDIWAGGSFTKAGAAYSRHIGRWANPEPVAVLIQSFDATRIGSDVELSWDIWTDEQISGFNIYRKGPSEDHEVRVNGDRLISGHERDYRDGQVEAGQSYSYVLGVVRSDGKEMRSYVVEVHVPRVDMFLFQVTPNPFNPTTRIRFTLGEEGPVALRIFGISGELVRTVVNRRMKAGTHEEEWDGRDAEGSLAASGVYFVRLRQGKNVLTRKAVLLK